MKQAGDGTLATIILSKQNRERCNLKSLKGPIRSRGPSRGE